MQGDGNPTGLNECNMNVDFGWASNNMAATKGNAFMQTWWGNIKDKLSRVCEAGAYEKETICCHEVNNLDASSKDCHIPWGYIEHLKVRCQDMEMTHAMCIVYPLSYQSSSRLTTYS